MGKVRVAIAYDELGRIQSIAQPATTEKVIVLSGEGSSLLHTEIEEDDIPSMATGSHRVDVDQQTVTKID